LHGQKLADFLWAVNRFFQNFFLFFFVFLLDNPHLDMVQWYTPSPPPGGGGGGGEQGSCQSAVYEQGRDPVLLQDRRFILLRIREFQIQLIS
jgi:hypothetical protein